MLEAVRAGLGFVAHAPLRPFQGGAVHAEPGKGLGVLDVQALGVGDHDFFVDIVEADADLGDPLVVGAGHRVGLDEERRLFLRGDGVGRDLDQVIGRRGEGSECRGLLLGGARGDEGRRFGRLLEPGEIQVVREGITRFLSLDDAEPDAHVQAPGRRRDLVLVEREAVCDGSLVVDLGEIAAPAEAGLEKLPAGCPCRVRLAELRIPRPESISASFPAKVLPDGVGDDERPRLHPLLQKAPPVHQAVSFENVHVSSFIIY